MRLLCEIEFFVYCLLFLFFFIGSLNEKGICCLKNFFIVLMLLDFLEYGEYGLVVVILLDKFEVWLELFDMCLFFLD